jgi:tRNA threonylcarbamoyladenosine biosynthesis protein TsaB
MQTNILSIETSSETCSVALRVRGEVRERFERAPMRHAERVLPMVEELMAEAGIALRQLDALAFGRGPGSFTGLRIGIGIVQGLAWGAERPVVPVSSLAAVAQTYFDRFRPEPGKRVCVAVDARMQEVYTARFMLAENGLAQPVSDERVGPPESIELLDDPSMGGAGNGFERYEPLVRLASKLDVCEPDCWPQAAAVVRLADGWMRENDPLPAHLAQPVYLRDKVAEKPD